MIVMQTWQARTRNNMDVTLQPDWATVCRLLLADLILVEQ